MDKILGETFRRGKDTATLDDVTKEPELIGLYFGAHWCPPVRGFNPVLEEFYTSCNKDKKLFEVIFCSNDGNEAAFERHFEKMPWTAIPYGDHRISNLKQKYGITGIPTLVVINKEGEVISMEGRNDVQSNSSSAFEEWKKLAKN
jgi:nucleoredoxin